MTERVVGAKMMLVCGDSILVMRRDDIPNLPWAGMWDLPGGGIEQGETPEDCVLREVWEETGLRLGPERIQHGEPRPSVSKPGRVGWYYIAHITQAEADAARLGDEGCELRLMPITEFIEAPDAIPAFRDAARDMLATG